MSAFLTNFIANVLGDFTAMALAALLAGLVLRYRNFVKRVRAGKTTVAPDGKHAAYEQGGEIYVARDGGLPHNLTRDPHIDHSPLWSPDSRVLVFMTARNDQWELFAADPDRKRLVPLVRMGGRERTAWWNKAGDLVVSLGGSTLTIHRAEINKKLGIV